MHCPARDDLVAGYNLVPNGEAQVRKCVVRHGQKLFVAVELPVRTKDFIHDGKLALVVDFFEVAADWPRNVRVRQVTAHWLQMAGHDSLSVRLAPPGSGTYFSSHS